MAVVVYFVILVVAFFVLIVLPQRRRLAAQRALVSTLREGEEVMTTSGIYGTIRSLSDATLELEIASGVVVTIARGAVAQRLGEEAGQGTPEETPAAPAEPAE